MTRLAALVGKIGFDAAENALPKDVYFNTYTPPLTYTWQSCPELRQAYLAVEQQKGEHDAGAYWL